MRSWKKIGHILICLHIVLALNALWTYETMAQNPPPRPSPGAGSGANDSSGNYNDDDDNDDDDGLILGDITGTVTDLSTGLPGAGLSVLINDIPIRTDASGHFSLTGIPDGPYIVDLSLPAGLSPAQPSQTVVVANREKVEVNLGYFSSKDTPSETVPLSNPPSTLPVTGYRLSDIYLNGILAGLILVAAGLLLQLWRLFEENFDNH